MGFRTVLFDHIKGLLSFSENLESQTEVLIKAARVRSEESLPVWKIWVILAISGGFSKTANV